MACLWIGSGWPLKGLYEWLFHTIKRGLMYDVIVTTMLTSSLPHQTVFSCSMEIPGTQFSKQKMCTIPDMKGL